MKSILLIIFSFYFPTFIFASDDLPKCEIEDGIGLYITVDNQNFAIETMNECFLIMQKTLYTILSKNPSDIGLTIPLKFTDIYGNETHCSAKLIQNDFIIDENFDNYLDTKNLKSLPIKDMQRLFLDFNIEKNKIGLDRVIPISCDYLGF